MKKMMLVLSISTILFTNNAFAKKTTIGKVKSKGDTYVVYTSGKGIFLKKGSTGFALVCDTRFVVKGDYVSSPDGTSYREKKSLLRAIQRRLILGKIKNCG